MTSEEQLREALADYAHDTWAGWMMYLFDKSIQNPDGSVLIPSMLVERWKRQIDTPYSALSQEEKTSDRTEALAIMAIYDHSAVKPEPKPIPNNLPAVWDLVIEDMRKRDQMGREKYGTPLQPFNGRRSQWDAYQEVLDLAVYLRQAIYEGENS